MVIAEKPLAAGCCEWLLCFRRLKLGRGWLFAVFGADSRFALQTYQNGLEDYVKNRDEE